jgi:glutamyl-tRNA synthetase
MPVRTRFAPSPTGYLHIGGVRTALFNWLFARHHEGQFILRVDDTDRERHVESALQPILDGFRWLGLDWDEGPEVGGPYAPYFQSERNEWYTRAVERLLEVGAAYVDFATAEEIQTEREEAQREKRRFTYSRRWMAKNSAQVDGFRAEGRSSVVRLKMPREGTCEFEDLVRGRVVVEWALEQDHVIQRADGTYLYHLATTVDDHEYRISHVIRAVEHLSNTPRQIFIARALGYDLPEYAHLPYVAAPGSRQKLSKRKLDTYFKNHEFRQIFDQGVNVMSQIGGSVSSEHFNPVTVDFYREVGYLPEALVNYLLLIGWSLDDKTETFSCDEMIRYFSLERVNKSAASFDSQKLLAFQERQMQALSLDDTVTMVFPFLAKAGLVSTTSNRDVILQRVAEVVTAAGSRIKIAGEILNYREFFEADDAITYDSKAVTKRLCADGAADRLLKFRDELVAVEPFKVDTLDRLLHQFVDQQGITVGQIIHALRVAVTGKVVGFGLFEGLAILGRQACLNRIDRAVAMIQTSKRSELG